MIEGTVILTNSTRPAGLTEVAGFPMMKVRRGIDQNPNDRRCRGMQGMIVTISSVYPSVPCGSSF
jgi:hypothetical protein